MINTKNNDKKINKKAPQEASNIFHNIVAASVMGNPKPKQKKVSKKVADNKNV